MRYAIIENTVVTNIAESDSSLAENWIPADETAHIGDLWDGSVFTKPVPPPPTVADYTEAVQNLLDTTAQAKHYDNIISCCSYAGAPNAFQAEGQAAIEWRGNVWATCYTIMAEVQAGTIPAPTIPELLAMLPDLVWP